jgi:hypothetical protein
MPYTPTSRDTPRKGTDNALTIAVFLAGLVVILILVGSVFFKPDQKIADETTIQPTTELPAAGDTRTP